MKTFLGLCLLTVAGLSAGCGNTLSGNATNSSASTDDVWYTKTGYVLYFIPTGSDVYYCPPAQAAGQKTCTKAVMHDE
jgi:hypothetical protein